jgi:pSer/pThr/pTyr-binding forkhead associated (FHA) protein
MRARLISLDYQVPHCDTSLSTYPVVIGQAADVGIRLSDQSIADRHCRIDCTGNDLFVTDLGSVHGTFVNGSRIGRSTLIAGDEFAVGMMTFLVQIEPEMADLPQTASGTATRENHLHDSPLVATA